MSTSSIIAAGWRRERRRWSRSWRNGPLRLRSC